MTYQQFPRVGIQGRLCCLAGGAVMIVRGTVLIVIGVGGFVIQQVHALAPRRQFGHGAGVGAIGVAAHRVGWGSEAIVGNRLSRWRLPVVASLDAVDGPCGNPVEINHLSPDVWQAWFLLDEIAAAGNAVLQRQRPYFHRAVFEDALVCPCVHGFKVDLVVEIGKEMHLHELHEGLQVRWSVNEQG